VTAGATAPSSVDGLPLERGASGDAVRDLHQRLAAAGFPVANAEVTVFTEATEAALRTFQEHRGLIVDGRCGQDSWSALVEAGYQLGDRLLYLRRPMLRGDDVANLQLRLGALGFDAGRVDGIFGPDSERALKDFQRNTALTTDGVCGPDVLAALERLGAKANGPASVAGVREREKLGQAPRGLAGRRITLADLGGVAQVVARLAASLERAGAVIQITEGPDHSAHARAANDFEAELFLGLAVSPDACPRLAYYSTSGFESLGGHQLAQLLSAHVHEPTDATDLPVEGMRLGLLRETRMPAVVCHLDATCATTGSEPGSLADRVASQAAAAIEAWVETPAS
jgi:N-acetylmuramoyl-L-alanine amidase